MSAHDRERPPGHGDPSRPGTTSRAGMDAALLGVMLFIACEVMFFAALFGAYFNVKATPSGLPPEGTEFITPVPVAAR